MTINTTSNSSARSPDVSGGAATLVKNLPASSVDFAFNNIFNSLNNNENISSYSKGRTQERASQVASSNQDRRERNTSAAGHGNAGRHDANSASDRSVHDRKLSGNVAESRVKESVKQQASNEHTTNSEQKREAGSSIVGVNDRSITADSEDVHSASNPPGQNVAAVDGSTLPTTSGEIGQGVSVAGASLSEISDAGDAQAMIEGALSGQDQQAIGNLLAELDAQLVLAGLAPVSSPVGTAPNESNAQLNTQSLQLALGNLQRQLNIIGGGAQVEASGISPSSSQLAGTSLQSINNLAQPLFTALGDSVLPQSGVGVSVEGAAPGGNAVGDSRVASELAALVAGLRDLRLGAAGQAVNSQNMTSTAEVAPAAGDSRIDVLAGTSPVTANATSLLQAVGPNQSSRNGELLSGDRPGLAFSGNVANVNEAVATVATERPAVTNLTGALNGAQASLQKAMASGLSGQAWPEEIQGNIKAMMAKGLATADLQLKPASLGALSIRIENGDEGSSIQFSVQSTVAKEQIEMHLPRLRELFTASQLALGDVSVSSEGDRGSEGSDSSSANNNRLASAESQNEAASESTVEGESLVFRSTGESLLDVYA